MVVAPVMPLERRCQYKCFAFVYPYASVKNMGSAAAVLFFGGGGWPQCLNWTDAKVRWRTQKRQAFYDNAVEIGLFDVFL